MKRITLIMVTLLMVWVSGAAQTQEKVRYGIGAGVNMTYNWETDYDPDPTAHMINKMLPGGDIYGLVNVRLGYGWIAEGRLGLSYNLWNTRRSEGVYVKGTSYETEHTFGLELPVMIGHKYGVGRSNEIYWLVGPSVSCLLDSSYNINFLWGANARIGIELDRRHRIEAGYTFKLHGDSDYGGDTPVLHVFGVSYAYMF